MTTPVPLEVLFAGTERTGAGISPDGTRLSWLAPVDGRLQVFVAPLDDLDAGRAVTDAPRPVDRYFWAYDGRHLCWLQSDGGDENDRIFAVDLETGEARRLTPDGPVLARVVSLSPVHPGSLYITLNDKVPERQDLHLLDLATGGLTTVAEGPGCFIDWFADPRGQYWGGTLMTDDGSVEVWVSGPAREWRRVTVLGADDMFPGPLGVDETGRGLHYLSATGADTKRLVRIDLEDGTVEVLGGDERYDSLSAIRNPATGKAEMVGVERARVELEVLDPALREDMDVLRQARRGDVTLTGAFGTGGTLLQWRDLADRTWVVHYLNDDGPVEYVLYDRAERAVRPLFVTQPLLQQFELAQMEPFTFRARDGLTVEGYLSYPPGAERRSLPTVVFVHGGPWLRDHWGIDPYTQFLATRGYLVMRVNFRGSLGYGKRFLDAGDKEWGAAMQDDLTDAVQWAVEQGYADPERVAILGGSYGGYATLAGAAFTPDVYRCGVAVVPPVNLITFIETIPPQWAAMRALFTKRVGDTETEHEFLWSRSPLAKVEEMKIPLLIAHGVNDPRVKIAESEQLVKALEERGHDFTYLAFEDEGHVFEKPESWLRLFTAVEAFLEKHLKGT